MLRFFKLLLPIFLLVLTSCLDDNPTPKPPTYLKTNLPAHSYHKETFKAPFDFNISDLYTLKSPVQCDNHYCEQEIYLGRALNGSINLFIKYRAKDSLPSLINFSNKEVDFHKIKANQIDFEQIIDGENRVYGTLLSSKEM